MNQITKHIEIEKNHYYHLGFPFTIDEYSTDIFNQGFHFGQFAAYQQTGKNKYIAVRDPLGIGKLFYTETTKGDIFFSEKFTDLFTYNSPVYSVPAGTMVHIESQGKRKLLRRLGIPTEINEALNAESFSSNSNQHAAIYKQRVQQRLNALFHLFRNYEDEGWTVFLALSGGLDSTIIASKAAKFLQKPIACTLDLGKSEDSEKSQKIANHLGINHMVYPTSEKNILAALEKAPSLCQDFRDFNVHCAALNILLAENIKQYVHSNNNINPNKVLVLTGDLMNEFTTDYAGEVIDGVEYYRLPRVGKKDLQQILISGLDTSDREISVFNQYGLNCVQPFAALYDLYASVHDSVFDTEDPKKLLNAFMADPEIMKFIPKTKLRAQVGSRENMGILGLCHKKGLNDKTFHNTLLKSTGIPGAHVPIFAGHYDIEAFD